MNRHNLKILGLSDGATKEEIEEAYNTLRAKYLEERFMDGEVGNTAARMLNEIETAHTELLEELSLNDATDSGDASAFARVEQLIKSGDIAEAQRALDGFNERGAHWHYLQSVVFYRKNWINESKKQLEIAMHLDTENQKYKDAYKKLNEKMEYDAKNHVNEGANQSAYNGQTMNSVDDDQMGGSFCSQFITCCYVNLCVNMCCNMCCR